MQSNSGYRLLPGLVTALLSAGLCAAMLAASRALTLGGGEGGLIGIPLGLMSVVVAIVLALVSFGVFRAKRWVLAICVLLMPVVWAIEFAYFLSLHGEIGTAVGWAGALALAGYYIWQLRLKQPAPSSRPFRFDPAVAVALVLAVPVVGELLALSVMAIVGFTNLSGANTWVFSAVALAVTVLTVWLIAGVHQRSVLALRLGAVIFPVMWVADGWVIAIHNLQGAALIVPVTVTAAIGLVIGGYYLRQRAY